MFGYVIVNKGDLTFREFDVYHSYYCGLCRVLKDNYGLTGQMSLNYDMTFLVLLLTSLYEPQTTYEMKKCIAHPFDRQGVSINKITQFGAEMNLLLTGYKCRNDWQDDRKILKKLYGTSLNSKIKAIKQKYSEKAEIIEVCFKNLEHLEKENCRNIDKMAGLFGKVMEELFIYQEDEWEEILRKLAYNLGKFIYILDAYEDIEEDIKKNRYNPFSDKYQEKDFEKTCRIVLTSAIAECSRAFEMLPLIDNIKILRNILYSGVWHRYEKIREERMKHTEKKAEAGNHESL